MNKLWMGMVLLLGACAQQPARQTATTVAMNDEIALVKPAAVGGSSINEALARRKSWREYSPEALSLEELSGVLWAAAGVNRADGYLTAPSALGLYPVTVYAFFPEGVYRYDATAEKLVRVVEGDYRRLTAMQDFAYEAPLNLVYIADMGNYEGRAIPSEHIRYLCGQDAAGYAENVNLYTAGHGMRSITRGSADETGLLELLQLAPSRYLFALAQTVGKAPQAAGK